MIRWTPVIDDAGIATGETVVLSKSAEEKCSQTVISSSPSGALIDVRELWRYRELLYFLIWRDVKVRYKQTVLGAGWAILQPAMMMIVFTVFFGRMAKVDSGAWPYPVFVYAGLLPWTFFATAVANAGNSVLGSERLITKIYFPRLLIPFASVGAALVDLVVASLGLILLMVYFSVPLTPGLLLLPMVIALITLAATGIGVLLAALNVAYRDFRYVIPFLMQLWLFATPSIYMETVASGAAAGIPAAPASATLQYSGSSFFEYFTTVAHWVLAANPMSGLIASFRAAAFGSPLPWQQLAMSSAVAIFGLMIGCLYFRRVEDSFADII